MSDRPNRRGSRSGGPTRTQSDLADVVELLLDKGIVINADIAVSIGDAELLGIQIRAAIASFETAARYGLEFPTGTDTERIEEIADATGIDDDDDDREIDRSEVGPRVMGLHEPPISESSPAMSGPPITKRRGDEDESESEDADGGEDDTYRTGSEPGVRERPTAPRASEADDAASETTANEGEKDGSEADAERDADVEGDRGGDTASDTDENSASATETGGDATGEEGE